MSDNPTLYERAVAISEDYLGPAGERFIRRQIAMHLAIEPEALRQKDMAKLVEWVRLTFALLTNESQYVEEFARDLMGLVTMTKRRSSNIKEGKNGDNA